MTMNPQGAHYTLMGIETLSLRMEKHIANAQKIATWLEGHEAVAGVTYAGLDSSPYKSRIEDLPERCRRPVHGPAERRL